MSRNQDWPDGVLKLVSREAYDAVRRAQGFGSMTPEQRLEAALNYDYLFDIYLDEL